MYFRRSLLVAAACTCAVPSFAQTNFQYQPYATPNGNGGTIQAGNAQLADFNGDGLADVLIADSAGQDQKSCGSPGCLWLYRNTGNGLAAPVLLPIGLGNSTEKQAAIADFNGDGQLDIAAVSTDNQVTILYGKGDGTFPTQANIATPVEGNSAIAVGDFDGNGTEDLAVLGFYGQLTLLLNNGNGSFTQKSITIDAPPSGYTTTSLVVGDLNADGRPDLAWVEQGNDDTTGNIVYTALNEGGGKFSAKTKLGTTVPGIGDILSADLDLDGRSDLIAWSFEVGTCCTNQAVHAYYSNGNGTFTAKTVATAVASSVAVTDINGDGNRDVLIANGGGVEVYTGNGNRTFTEQGTYTSLPKGASQLGVGFLNATMRIGFAAMDSDNKLDVVSNDNAQGDCEYPASAGVKFCEAQANGSSVLVRGTARAQTAPVERIELWANGKKLYQVFADEFDATLDLPAGTQITAVEVEANGRTKSATVTPSSTQTCAAPSSPGVHVCAPTQGESTKSPVTFRAAGTGASGSVNHLELWIDGSKIGNYSGSSMNTQVSEPSGSHTATVVEVDSKGNYVKSSPVTYTVQ